jgi:ubiquinone/menaquinone biosynthesis C-methylase UbiE
MEREPSPDLFFDTLTGYQKSAALKAAIDLDIFTALSDGALTAVELAKKCNADARGVRILCDYMTIYGFLLKTNSRYGLTPDSEVFLSRKSPAYAGGAAAFLLSDELIGAFKQLSESARKGGTAVSAEGTIAPEHPIWLSFARTMGGLMFPAAQGLAELLALPSASPAKVLDVAAGHGIWGIAMAQKYSQARVVALDWAPVLEIARENATKLGVAERFSTLAGSAFQVELGTDYDVVLIPNFLHHFSSGENVQFLKKVHRALKPDGRVAIAEFVPNEDRISPPSPAAFSLVMLAMTPRGDAYTFEELSAMLKEAGFQKSSAHPLPASVNQAVISKK